MKQKLRITTMLLVCALMNACEKTDLGVIYIGKTIVTMDATAPAAQADSLQAIVVKNGNIEALGTIAEMKALHPQARIDDSLADQVIVPGFIDPHVHMIMGAMIYSRPFIPPWDMETPAGLVKAANNKSEFLARLTALEATQDNDDPLIVYGYHNLVHGDINRYDLDQISISRPILVWHYSAHDFYLNSAALDWAGVEASWAKETLGVDLDAAGKLTGRLYEEAPKRIFNKLAFHLLTPSNIERGFSGFERMLAKAGVTSAVELGYGLFGRRLEDLYYWLEYTDDDRYYLYLVPEYRAFAKAYGNDAVQKIRSMSQGKSANLGTPKVLPQVKFFNDGAFYSQTMKLSDPGYLSGQSAGTDGVWATEPDTLLSQMTPFWEAGLDLRIHSNGDAAQEVTLSAMSELDAQRQHLSQRFVIEHAALLNSDAISNLARLGGGVSAASHYVHYMGENYKPVIGEKVDSMTPLKSLYAANVPTSLHSDAPLAPPYPLQAASVHLLRSTRQGITSTQSEQLSRYQALESITLNAAWSMGLEDQLGSISVGKRANFTVLEQNPLELAAHEWPNIKIWGVVLGGEARPIDYDSE